MASNVPLGPPLGTFPASAPNSAGALGRRSSYATVAAGGTSTSGSAHTPMTRMGAFSHLLSQAQQAQQQSGPSQSGQLHPAGSNLNGDALSDPARPDRGRVDLPQQSSAFRFLTAGTTHNAVKGSGSEAFMTPTYLRASRYVERLAEAHQARLAAQRDAPQTHAPNGGSLSTSPSSANLHKMAMSHRGMTYDIIEKEPAVDTSGLTPLPSRWSDRDRFGGLDLHQEGFDVRFVGQGRSQEHIEAAAVRADHFMPPQCGIYYYEVLVTSKGKEGTIGVGFSSSRVSLNRLPGWEPESWAYHGDDGRSFCCSDHGREYGPKFGSHDIIGCGVNFRTGCAFFTKNGVFLGVAFRDVKGKLFPSVGMKKPGEAIKANFGHSPFLFDIDGLVKADRSTIEEAIRTTSTAKLRPPLGESSLLQRLVAQYLAHEGYFGSAMAFAEEVRAEADGLRINGQGPRADFHVKEDVDALNRQRIRVAILDGDIDKAFKYTYACYPNVLKDNEQIYFRMRCRKFIEMNRRCSELRLMAGRQSIRRAQSSIARTGRSYAARDDEQEEDDDEDVDDDEDDDDDDDDDDGAEEEDDDDDQKKGHDEDANEEENRERHRGSVFDEEMEVDEQVQEGGADWDGMEMEENGGADDADDAADDADDAADDAAARHFNLLQETLEYGQELRQEFRDDHRREVKKTLEDTFSLLAYEEPMSSVVAHLLEPSGRVPVAEDLNAAILVSLGKSATSSIERIFQQAEVLVQELAEEGGGGGLINVRKDYMQ